MNTEKSSFNSNQNHFNAPSVIVPQPWELFTSLLLIIMHTKCLYTRVILSLWFSEILGVLWEHLRMIYSGDSGKVQCTWRIYSKKTRSMFKMKINIDNKIFFVPAQIFFDTYIIKKDKTYFK